MPFAITIPTGRSADGSGPRGPVISLPIGNRPGSSASAGPGTRTNADARAALVAAALLSPQETAALVEKVREDPGTVPDLTPAQKDRIKTIRDAIKAAQDDLERPFSPTEGMRMVSAAIGADPRLAAAADEAIKKDAPTAQAVRLWALAILDDKVLESAGLAAKKASAMTGTSTTPAQISELSKKVDALEARTTKAETNIDALDKRVTALEGKVGDVRREARDEIDRQVKGLREEFEKKLSTSVAAAHQERKELEADFTERLRVVGGKQSSHP